MKKAKKTNLRIEPLATPAIEEKIELPETRFKIVTQAEFNEEEFNRSSLKKDDIELDQYLSRHKFRCSIDGNRKFLTGSFANVSSCIF
jgi:hypothetical protein